MVSKFRVFLIILLVTVPIFLCNCEGIKGRKSAAENEEGEKITFTYWVEKAFDAPAAMKSYSENDVYQELEKRTGIHIEFIHPASGEVKEQFNLMIASDNLPDIIEGYVDTYPNGVDQAVADGVYLKLNNLIEKYAPNFKAIRESNIEIARQTITDAGNIWCFPCIQTMNEPAWRGPIIRGDWLEELNMKIPASIQEWYTVLKAFKNKKGVSIPLIYPKSGVDWGQSFVGAYNTASSFYMRDGKVRFGPIESNFKDYLTTINKWYKEGLIDKDFATQDDKIIDTLFTGGKAGAAISAYGTFDIYQNAMKTTAPGAIIKSTPYPSLIPGDKVHLRQANYFNKGIYTVITTSCKYPEEAVKWFDYHYGNEGFMLFNYGIENKSYKLVDGKPQFTDLMIKNPEGFSYMAMAWQHKLHMGPYKRDYRAFPITPEIQECIDTWDKALDDWVIPPTNLTPEENKRYLSLMNTISIYKDDMILKFIQGTEPLSKFDEYVNQIKLMGIGECLEIQQAALERYYKR